jgi:hypothetical protein
MSQAALRTTRIRFRSTTLEEEIQGVCQQTQFIEAADKSFTGKRQAGSKRCYVRATASSAGSFLSINDCGLKIDRTIHHHDKSA